MTVADDDTIASSLETLSPASEGRGPELAQLIANRYQVVRWLGGGGMGRVYEVIDTELDERVALKVLRGGLSEEGIERFRREVKLTRRIQHRNVCRMFDIGEHASDKFLTMELVDGQPLGAALGQERAWQRLHNLALQICEGLAAAHAVGVVHRDLKPDNVLVERATDRAVITDFGIARGGDDANVTQVGTIVGTPRYMAPEQLAGRDIDVRADLFSLGVMLYELATGTRPWSGDNAIAIAVAQATQPARPFASAIAPRWFGEIIMRCVAVDREQRVPTADELARMLAAGAVANAFSSGITGRPTRITVPPPPSPTAVSAAPTTQVPETALAVLPLACAPGDEYLADGVMEDLMDTLSSASLRVCPAGVARGTGDADPRALGTRLGVDHVVAGSVRRTTTGLRVSARVIGVADGFQIWAHRTDCTEAQILDVADELARGIASALSTRAHTAARPTDPRAVELYLRAKAELRRFWSNHARAAADLLEEAAQLSPDSAPIAGTLAQATTQAWNLSAEPELRDRAERAIKRGLELGAAEAYLASAAFKLSHGDVEGGATDLGTALVRGPMVAATHEQAGRMLVEIASTARARHHFDTAIALDPQRADIIALDLARLDALEGNWDAADAAVELATHHEDPSIVQLSAVFRARLAGWRDRRDEVVSSVPHFAPRMAGYMAQFIAFISDTAGKGSFDRTLVQQFLATFGATDRPMRGRLMGLQILTEISLLYRHFDIAHETLQVADTLNFMDLVAFDRCPLFRVVDGDPRFATLRDRIAERAERVLAALEAASGSALAPR